MPTRIKVGTKVSFPLKRSIAFAIMSIVCLSSIITVMAAVSINVQVVDDGQPPYYVEVSSEKDILSQVKAKLKTPVAKNDMADYNSATNAVTIRRAFMVTVKADGMVKTLMVHYGDSVQNALLLAHVTLGAADRVIPFQSTKVRDKMTITVVRQKNVVITADGSRNSYIVPNGTVENAIKASGITLGKEDTLNVDKNAQVSDNMEIYVNRVAYYDETSTQSIAYKTITQKTDSLNVGTTKVQTVGKNGSQTVVTRQKLVDGNVIESTVINTTVTQQATDQVTLVGTKAQPSASAAEPQASAAQPSASAATSSTSAATSSTSAAVTSDGVLIDQSGREVKYSKCLSGRCTAYTSNGGYTATGARAQFGYVAVNPNLIPYGTRLYICSANGKTVYGYAIASDTGGGVMSGSVLADLYYDTQSQCRNFGSRNMVLYVLS